LDLEVRLLIPEWLYKLCWSHAVCVSGLHHAAGGEVALGGGWAGVWQGQSCVPRLAPSTAEQQRSWGRVTSPLQEVFPSSRGCTGCISCSALLRGLFAMQVAGRKGWSHLVGVWACTRPAEGWAKAETYTMLTQQV